LTQHTHSQQQFASSHHPKGNTEMEILTTATWPVLPLLEIVKADPAKVKPAKPTCKPIADKLTDHLVVMAGVIPKIVIAILFMLPALDYEAAKRWDLKWMASIIVRDLIIHVGTAAVWDWIVYGLFHDKMMAYKFNPKYPDREQLKRDATWTVIATILSSVQEIIVINLWATGVIAKYDDFWAFPVLGIFWLFSMPYWRLCHFYIIHRAMHPWNTKRIPDIGALLYKYGHAHHHKSYNPTAFSGISMTPIESITYFSAALIPCLFVTHPIVHLVTKSDLALGAIVGHDGFGSPGGGSYAHYLHHAHFTVNYGENYAPLDWLFGTFSDGTKYNKTATAAAAAADAAASAAADAAAAAASVLPGKKTE
jgi:sterol desaturase/sphingolipid hydroxylase (fatty acid hydroxylase superfamily)